MKLTRRDVIASLALGLQASARAGSQILDPFERASLLNPRAGQAVLLAICRAARRVVAVGERGVVLLSDDDGKNWRQVKVPVSITLTAVQFIDAALGWAVGHAGVVLHTQDGGETWARQLDGVTAAQLALSVARGQPAQTDELTNAQRLVADGPDKPFLDVHFYDARRGFVAGAYGLIFGTEDGGVHWSSWISRIDNTKGLHINAAAVRGDTLLLAGEQGQLWLSLDAGEHFTRLTSPYGGSWFAAVVLPSGRFVLAGLKGNVFISDDQGHSFQRSTVSQQVTVNTFLLLAGGPLLAFNQAGQALVSRNQGLSFQALSMPPGAPINSVVELSDGALVGASQRGPRQLHKLT
ncbi:MAG: YCF48-related protein [Rhodoferax sp.]|nr:YCF48-related protein [Rhodoferax sp.]